MTAGALTLVTTPASTPFVLQVGGRNLTGRAPLGDAFAWHVSEVSDGSPSQMDFWVEDTAGTIDLRIGDEVRFTDRRSGSDTIFGGHLVNVQMTRRESGYGRYLHCTAVGYDAYLDWRIVGAYARWSSKTKKANGQVTQINGDRGMVQQLVNKFAGFLRAPDQTVTLTNSNMDVVVLDGVTLRDGLDRVVETASTVSPEANRKYYVDRDKAIHYYQNFEGLTAPYRISDGSYTQTVLATTGLVALWEMDGDGAVVVDQKGGRHAALTGGYQRGLPGGIANESLTTATFLDGSTGVGTAPVAAALHPGDTFSWECWYKRGRATTAIEHLYSNDANDFTVRFDATDHLVIRKVSASDVWTTNGTFEDTTSWHHLVVTKSGSARAVYVDGDLKAGSGSNATIVAAPTSVAIIGGSFSSTLTFRGSLQHVALYNVALSAATVLAHYQQGASIVAENLVYELAGTDGREAVYVAGGNDAGSGWVRPGVGNSVSMLTAFGQDEKERQEIILRSDSKSVAKRNAYGAAFLKANQDPKRGGSFTVTAYGGWHVAQTVYITDAAYGLSGEPFEITQVDVDLLMGSGTCRYDITYGKPLRSGTRRIRRRRRGGGRD